MSARTVRHALAVPAMLSAMVASLTVSGPGSAHAVAPLDPVSPVSYAVAERVTIKSRAALPVSGYHLTGEFGDVSGLWSSVHTGLDFAAPEGSPIHAVMDGTVTSSGYDGAYGNKTVLTLRNGTELWFCHQSAVTVAVGQEVAAGDLLGYVGSTGNVTGPHLHLEVRPGGGSPTDPVEWLRAEGLTP